jgi:RimJ/RimL family protein N-acetyltransferase
VTGGAAPDWPLRTERLELRPHDAGDLEAFHAIRSNPEVARYLYNEPLSLDEARAKLDLRIGARALAAENDWLPAAIVERASGVMVGDVGLNWRSVEHRTGEIGFTVDPAYQGRGYATEAARALLDWGFREFGLHRVIGRTEVRNTGSARVLERLGMRLEATLVENEWVKGEWQSELQYAILRREWAG